LLDFFAGKYQFRSCNEFPDKEKQHCDGNARGKK
jgi:hypothetical protein